MIDQTEVNRFYEALKLLVEKNEELAIRREVFRRENEALTSFIDGVEAVVALLKEDIAKQAVCEFEVTGKKKLSHGLGIRVKTILTYDADVALEWAIGSRLALKLDVATFEKNAIVNHLPFVTFDRATTVTFPTDYEKLVSSEHSE